jgi:pimeloyl-ACP methyl ester carboxylesterase
MHGGPGMPIMYLAHEFQRGLEDDFIVVQWDRRGAGKSYSARLPLDHLTSNQLVDDTVEVSQYLRDRFGQRPIVIVGHSWGTYVALRAVAERPDLYLAYVGVGQMSDADPLTTGASQRSLVREAAKIRGLTSIETSMSSTDAPTEDEMFKTGGELHSASSFLPLIWNEGHGVSRRENLVSYLNRSYRFLAEQLRLD